jgi:acyl-CoA reductase-like NAD-dependent aldehyde dehydrogenase
MPRSLAVRNPRTGVVDCAVGVPDAGELRAHAGRLRRGQAPWSEAGLAFRTAALQRFKDRVLAGREALLEALTADTGRLRLSGVEVDVTLGSLAAWCALAPSVLARAGSRSRLDPRVRIEPQQVPYGLVGVISPWNFPLTLALIDAVPALLAGCAVLIKPSEVTPRFIGPLMGAVEAVPELASVMQVVAGDGETGAQVIDEADAVCFTGSVATGRKVAEAAARRFIPAFLELGGKDPAVVLASADLDRAATAILRGAVANTGQVCYSIERVYVDDAVHDRLVQALVAKARALDLNYPDIRQGHLGPFIFARQAEVVEEHLRDAVARGARVLCGGQVEEKGGGLYMRATVVAGANHSMRLMTEETFGPVVPVMRVAGEDEAVALANDSRYGLSAAVFAGTEEEALRVGRRLNAGAVSVNDAALTGAILQDAEKNSFNLSGMGGSRVGPASLRRFLRQKALIVNEGSPAGAEAIAEDGAAAGPAPQETAARARS